MHRVSLALAVAALLTLAACGDSAQGPESSTTAPSSSGPLDGRKYVSTAVTGRQLVAESAITLNFDAGALAVNAGCNTITGPYAVEGGTLSYTSEPASTMMACSEELMQQDQWLASWLRDGVALTESADGLTLTAAGVTTEFESRTDESFDALVGPIWTLTSTSVAGAAAPVPAGTEPPTLEFTEEGFVNVFAGCNNGTAALSISGEGVLRFAPLRLTKMACGDAEMALERTVVAVLDGEVQRQVSGAQLTLTKGDTSLTFTSS